MDTILSRYYKDYLNWERLYAEWEALQNSCDPQWENLQEGVFEALTNPLPETYSVNSSGRLVPVGPFNLLEALPKEEGLVSNDPADQLERLIAFGKQSVQRALQKELASQIEQESQDMQRARKLMEQSGESVSIMTGRKLQSYPSLDFSHGEVTHDLAAIQEELEMGNLVTATEHYLSGRNQLATLAVYDDGRKALKNLEKQERAKGLGILIVSAAGGHLLTSGAILAGFAPEVAATFVAPFGFLTTNRAFHGNLWNSNASTGENFLDWTLDYATTASMFKYVGVTTRGLVGEMAGPFARYGAESAGFATWTPMENIFHQAISGGPFDEQQFLSQTASSEALLDQQATLLGLKAGGYPLRGVMKPLDRIAMRKSLERAYQKYLEAVRKAERAASPGKPGWVFEYGGIGGDGEPPLTGGLRQVATAGDRFSVVLGIIGPEDRPLPPGEHTVDVFVVGKVGNITLLVKGDGTIELVKSDFYRFGTVERKQRLSEEVILEAIRPWLEKYNQSRTQPTRDAEAGMAEVRIPEWAARLVEGAKKLLGLGKETTGLIPREAGLPLISGSDYGRLYNTDTRASGETVAATFDFQGLIREDRPGYEPGTRYVDSMATNGILKGKDHPGIHVGTDGIVDYSRIGANWNMQQPSDVGEYVIYIKIPSELQREKKVVVVSDQCFSEGEYQRMLYMDQEDIDHIRMDEHYIVLRLRLNPRENPQARQRAQAIHTALIHYLEGGGELNRIEELVRRLEDEMEYGRPVPPDFPAVGTPNGKTQRPALTSGSPKRDPESGMAEVRLPEWAERLAEGAARLWDALSENRGWKIQMEDFSPEAREMLEDLANVRWNSSTEREKIRRALAGGNPLEVLRVLAEVPNLNIPRVAGNQDPAFHKSASQPHRHPTSLPRLKEIVDLLVEKVREGVRKGKVKGLHPDKMEAELTGFARRALESRSAPRKPVRDVQPLLSEEEEKFLRSHGMDTFWATAYQLLVNLLAHEQGSLARTPQGQVTVKRILSSTSRYRGQPIKEILGDELRRAGFNPETGELTKPAEAPALEQAPIPEGPPIFKLVGMEGTAEAVSPQGRSEWILGRQGQPVDIGLQDGAGDRTISRRHTRIVYEGDSFHVELLSQSSSIQVNGKPLKQGEKVPLKNGDSIHFGIDLSTPVYTFNILSQPKALPHDFAQRLFESVTNPDLQRVMEQQKPKEVSNGTLPIWLKDVFGQLFNPAKYVAEDVANGLEVDRVPLEALAELVLLVNKARKAGIEVSINEGFWSQALALTGRGQTQIGYPPPPK